MQTSIRGTVLVAVFVLLLAFSIPSLRSIFAVEPPLATPFPKPTVEPVLVSDVPVKTEEERLAEFEYLVDVRDISFSYRMFDEYLAHLDGCWDPSDPSPDMTCRNGAVLVVLGWEANNRTVEKLHPPRGYQKVQLAMELMRGHYEATVRHLVIGLELQPGSASQFERRAELEMSMVVLEKIAEGWDALIPVLDDLFAEYEIPPLYPTYPEAINPVPLDSSV